MTRPPFADCARGEGADVTRPPAADRSSGRARGEGADVTLPVVTDSTRNRAQGDGTHVPRPVFAAAAGPGAWTLRVVVTPGGSRDVLAGLAEDRLRVRLRAKAVEGAANASLTGFVAGLLGLRARQVAIVAGEKSRRKTLRIETESEPDWSAVTGMGWEENR